MESRLRAMTQNEPLPPETTLNGCRPDLALRVVDSDPESQPSTRVYLHTERAPSLSDSRRTQPPLHSHDCWRYNRLSMLPAALCATALEFGRTLGRGAYLKAFPKRRS